MASAGSGRAANENPKPKVRPDPLVSPRYEFDLDDFQRDACDALDEGESVLVAAPTSSGKTVVAEYAIELALAQGQRAFYTTPIKALSNQKFNDFCDRYGTENVGLLTGDNSVRGDAPIVVMTTEVLRNMMYARISSLDDLRYVVLDEVHYLQDTWRGPVWEEVIVHLPLHVDLVCLSATVSNADELAAWISSVRTPMRTVFEAKRPVDLEHLYMIGERGNRKPHLIPTLYNGRANRDGSNFDVAKGSGRAKGRNQRDKGGKGGRGGDRRNRPYVTPRRLEVLSTLSKRNLLPVIYFIFSRVGCADAMARVVDSGARYTDDDERRQIEAIIDRRLAGFTREDLEVLDFPVLNAALTSGVAAHHAGMVPAFKELVEECFIAGLVKVVFATETLAMGVNMPARTVVIEKLMKYNGETHVLLSAGQYTQLTGRAGRRGLDDMGSAVVLWNPFVAFDQIAGLASSRSFKLHSAFRPTYNMAANLVRNYERDRAYDLLGRSFAQFQTEISLEKRRSKAAMKRKDIDRLKANMDPADLEQHAAAAEEPPTDLTDMLSRLKPGDILVGLPDADRAAVLSVAYRKGAVRLRVLDEFGDVIDYLSGDLQDIPEFYGRLELPSPFDPNNRAFQDATVAKLRKARRSGASAGGDKPARAPRGSSVGKLDRLERELADVERQITDRQDSITGQFDAVLGILDRWGHIDGWSLTEAGERTVRIYHELDLLVAEAIGRGLFDGLSVPDTAGLASLFVYEHRSKEPPPEPWFSSDDLADRARSIIRMARDLNREEHKAHLTLSREPDPTIFAIVHAWAAGLDLADVLDDELLTGGDFVRTSKQLIDLLRQIGDAAPNPDTRHQARSAADAVARGVVVSTAETLDDDLADGDLPEDAVPRTGSSDIAEDHTDPSGDLPASGS